jgi:dTDP-4-amino-4,6-dideoxygalactose transaminase
VAEELAQKGLSLPSSAGLNLNEVDRVCDAIAEIGEQGDREK